MHGTDPLDSDGDDDYLSDGEEIAAGTDPANPDSEGDGLGDASEVRGGTDPWEADTDDDGLTDADERFVVRVTNFVDEVMLDSGTARHCATLAADLDGDGDGFDDGTEYLAGSALDDPASTPAAPAVPALGLWMRGLLVFALVAATGGLSRARSG